MQVGDYFYVLCRSYENEPIYKYTKRIRVGSFAGELKVADFLLFENGRGDKLARLQYTGVRKSGEIEGMIMDRDRGILKVKVPLDDLVSPSDIWRPVD